MAGRFLFQKLASEWTGLLSSARDLAPLTRHASQGGIGTLGRLFNGYHFPGPSAHPSTLAPKHYGVDDYAAKSLPSFSRAAKMSNPTTGMPSHLTKPASLDSVRGLKRTFSSSSSDKGVVDWEAQKAIFLARLEAKKANFSKAFYESEKAAIIARTDACKVEAEADAKATREKLEALKERLDKQSAEFNRFLNILMIGFTAVTLIVTYEFRWSPRARRGNESLAAAGGAAVENPSVA